MRRPERKITSENNNDRNRLDNAPAPRDQKQPYATEIEDYTDEKITSPNIKKTHQGSPRE